MTITSISAQKKRQGYYNIFIDDAYVCSLSANALLDSGIKTGDELDEQQKQALIDVSNRDHAYSALLHLIARRPRSAWEAEQYLRKKGHDQALIDDIVSALKQKAYLDDRAFAESWIRSRRLTRPTSQKKLRYELQQKRVPGDIIDESLDSDEKEDADVLHELIEKKRRHTRYKNDEKLMRYLAGQGFHYGDIKTALEQFRQEDC